MYMKIVTEGMPRHLCVMNSISYEAKTVCGVILTEYHSWKRIEALEGDECQFVGPRHFIRLSQIHLLRTCMGY
jgi:hypothetical protein